MPAAIVWFRQDLRLTDNPAWAAAIASGALILPLYILDDETPGAHKIGGAQRWWLHHSLTALDQALQKFGSRLILRKGRAKEILAQMRLEQDISGIYWNRCYEPFAINRDQHLKQALREQGLTVESFNGYLFFEPWQIKNKSGQPYKVFSQFWKACLQKLDETRSLVPSVKSLSLPDTWPESDALSHWQLLPTHPNWAVEFDTYWRPGEKGAQAKLQHFLENSAHIYKHNRNYPGIYGTSRLSPHLHFGEISPQQILAALKVTFPTGFTADPECYLSELGWREFSTYLLYHFSNLATHSFRPEYDSFRWDNQDEDLIRWQKGLTGYPIVDAGMRELWHTGWMHNRVRMTVASFLTKDLFVDWRRGQEWFWDTLVDANLANNVSGWQWVAGCGADAAPYFRIFNPVLQGEKFDPEGTYVKRWIPELSTLSKKYIHQPWTAPSQILTQANIVLGETYPRPMVDHNIARQQALARMQELKASLI